MIAGPTKRYIDPDSAEGVRITKDLEAANRIMSIVRPRWKDGGKGHGKAKQQPTAQPKTLVIASPTQPASSSNAGTIPPAVLSQLTRSTSKSIVPPHTQTITRAVVSSPRTTRSKPNANVTIPGLSTITAAIIPTTTISRTTLHTAPKIPETTHIITASGSEGAVTSRTAAVPVTSNSNKIPSQEKPRTVKVPIEVDVNEDHDQSMEDAGNNPTVAHDELQSEDSQSDDSEEGHLTDNVTNNTTSVDKSTPDEIAPGITTLVTTVVAPTRQSDLASFLQKTDLFNKSILECQQKDLESEGLLLRQQYRARKPRVQDVLPNPSSLKLPETDGPTLVEQLMQLGERCQWITQKNEAIKGYLRALDEQLFLTLLGVEQLFDSRYLKRLFNRDRSGAGICTKRLMDKVEEMVRKSMDNSKAGDTRDETFQFNAKEILGSQYQQKFCNSVKVTIKPYDGKDQYLHMAQHFREVRNVSH
jgi:hypothetical protein